MGQIRLARWASAAGILAVLISGLPAVADASTAAGPVGKARPPLPGASATQLAASRPASFYYASAYAYPSTSTVTGASTVLSAHRPRVDPLGHTLAELAVTSADGRQIVEVGWTVDKGLYGDTQPRVFVYHWVDGRETCYNHCGFVWSGASPGAPVFVSNPQTFAIEHESGKWSVYRNHSRIGYFPDSLWGGRFTRPGLVQVFGEVADTTTSSPPCGLQMGTGTFPGPSSGGSISAVLFLTAGWGSTANLGVQSPTPAYYQITKTGTNSARYGGPGARC